MYSPPPKNIRQAIPKDHQRKEEGAYHDRIGEVALGGEACVFAVPQTDEADDDD